MSRKRQIQFYLGVSIKNFTENLNKAQKQFKR